MDRAHAGRLAFVVAAFAALLLAAEGANADGTVSERNSAAASISEQTPLPNWPTDPLTETLLTATISSGKRHRMLFIQATLGYNGTDASLIGLEPTVNGFGVEPPSRSVVYCTGGVCDTVSGSWWLDLDQAEADHAGMFIGKPLLVRLIGGEITGGGSPPPSNGEWNASLSVQMTKK